MSRLILLSLLAGLGAAASAASGASQTPMTLKLVDQGAARAAIVIAETPTRAAQLGAYELQHHIALITGATLPIVTPADKVDRMRILVGDSRATRALGLSNDNFANQEYAIAFKEKVIVLIGRDKVDVGKVNYDLENPAKMGGLPSYWDEVATLYAVYDFLEKSCDVRWFNPTEFGTSAPRKKTLTITARDIRRKPRFEYRDALAAIGDDMAGYDAYISLWRWQAVVNKKGDESYQQWDRLAYPTLHKKYPQSGPRTNARRQLAHLFLLRMRNGGRINRCNHSVGGYYDRFWNKTSSNFVAGKPQFFAQGYDPKSRPPQLCYSNKELIQQVAQDARDYYDGKVTGQELGIFWRPNLPNMFPLEPEDNAFFCKCPDCQRFLDERRSETGFNSGAYSDYFFTFVNAVARELRKTHPDKSILTLAYMTHAQLPSFPLEPNVAIQYCFVGNRDHSSDGHKQSMELLKRWSRSGKDRPVYLWLYYTFPVESAGNGRYFCFPGFFAHTIDQQFKRFAEYGVRGVFHCGYGQEIEAYITFKMMDDPTQNVDELLDDYFTRLYGPAAEPMKTIYLEIEKVYGDLSLSQKPAKRVSAPEFNWKYLGTPERMARYEQLLGQANKLATSQQQRHRIAMFEKSVWDYMLAGQKQYTQRATAKIPSIHAARVPDANGDLEKVDWSKATLMGERWYLAGSGNHCQKKLSGKIACDSQYIYVQLEEENPGTLRISPAVFPCDDWEIFISNQRDRPLRQYAISPTGKLVVLSQGEVNMRENVPMPNTGVKTWSKVTGTDRWVTRAAIPMRTGLPKAVRPGDKVYMNVNRVSGPRPGVNELYGVYSWVSYMAIHEADRMVEITLGESTRKERVAPE